LNSDANRRIKEMDSGSGRAQSDWFPQGRRGWTRRPCTYTTLAEESTCYANHDGAMISKAKKDKTDKIEVEPGADKRLANILKKALNTPPAHVKAKPRKKPKAK
jgi:hypothetical protein